MKLDEAQVGSWRDLLQQEQEDATWVQRHRDLDQRRLVVRREMLGLLSRFQESQVSVQQLKATFDTKTRTEWEGFGFKGLSGAMFLNKLVKHIKDEGRLTDALKSAMRLPADEPQARERMTTFMRFLKDIVGSGKAKKQQLQPARAPFFVSAWWHLQDTEIWPVYYITARRTLQRQGLFAPIRDPVEDYFGFRVTFLGVAAALGLRSWEFEHLCSWCDHAHGAPKPPPEPPGVPGPSDGGDDNGREPPTPTGITHTEVQYLLAEIGQHFGCHVWIAANDHAKQWMGKQLGSLSLPTLPNLGIGTASQKVISMIDVLWLKSANQVVAAFEIEHSTSVYSGLLRMCDLTVLAPNLSFPLYIVAPEERLEKVRRQLSRPSFQELELHNRCSFFSSERLVKEAQNIKAWASDPSAIENIAERVADAAGEEVA